MDSVRHKDKIVGKNTHHCAICNIQYAFRSGLNKHNNIHHKIVAHEKFKEPQKIENVSIVAKIVSPGNDKNPKHKNSSSSTSTKIISPRIDKTIPHKNLIDNQEVEKDNSNSSTVTKIISPNGDKVYPIIKLRTRVTVDKLTSITREQFIELFPERNKSTIQRTYYELRKYYPNNDLPINWKDILIHDSDKLVTYAENLDPSSGKRFLLGVYNIVPELQGKLVTSVEKFKQVERDYLEKKQKPTQDCEPGKEYIDKLFKIIKEIYRYPFRFQEICTAKVKREGDNRVFADKNYYDLITGIFHINDDKVKIYYSGTTIKFDQNLVGLLSNWFSLYNLTDNFILSVNKKQLTASSFRYILNQLEITPTRSRKIYANHHKDEIEGYKNMRHSMLVHQTNYIDTKK
jgi:hypothetical protein